VRDTLGQDVTKIEYGTRITLTGVKAAVPTRGRADFLEASQTLSFNFSITRQQKNEKTIGAYTECTDLIF
jgi:hypothetical protein